MRKQCIFYPMDYVSKINTMRDMRCCDYPYVTAEAGCRLQARFASLSIARNDIIITNTGLHF